MLALVFSLNPLKIMTLGTQKHDKVRNIIKILRNLLLPNELAKTIYGHFMVTSLRALILIFSKGLCIKLYYIYSSSYLSEIEFLFFYLTIFFHLPTKYSTGGRSCPHYLHFTSSIKLTPLICVKFMTISALIFLRRSLFSHLFFHFRLLQLVFLRIF